jgi:hypothetical protein
LNLVGPICIPRFSFHSLRVGFLCNVLAAVNMKVSSNLDAPWFVDHLTTWRKLDAVGAEFRSEKNKLSCIRWSLMIALTMLYWLCFLLEWYSMALWLRRRSGKPSGSGCIETEWRHCSDHRAVSDHWGKENGPPLIKRMNEKAHY